MASLKESAPGRRMTCTLMIILLLLFGLAFTTEAKEGHVADLARYPQDPRFLVTPGEAERPLLSPSEQETLAEEYRSRHFAPWTRSEAAHSADEAFWALDRYRDRPAWGENLQRRDGRWVADLAAYADRGNYPTRADRAILVDNTPLRSLPTERPHFNDPALPGEGYPFDNFQNSTAWAGTPLLVTHQSVDGAWLHVETPFAAGWVRPSQVAFVDRRFIEVFTESSLAVFVADDVAVSDTRGRHRFLAQTGTLLPLLRADAFRIGLLVPYRDGEGRAHLEEAILRRGQVVPFPLTMTPWKVATVASRLAGKSYGWGGLYGNRDCSALTRDLFAPFGLWLPRNSSGQRRSGQVIDLSGMSDDEKKALIVAEGEPFASLIGMDGHIMVYVGSRQGTPLVFHSLWGLKTLDEAGKPGRKVIGRAVVTSLDPGREDRSVAAGGTLAGRVSELVLLTR